MKHIKLFEDFIGEAARVGRSSWRSVLSDLARHGWDIKGNLATKFYDEDDNERKIELDNSGDEVNWTVYDGRGKELNSGSFDAEGLSAGELDGEVWDYIDEGLDSNKDTSEMLKEVYESACAEAIAYEGDDNEEHTIEEYLKEMAAINAGMMAEMYEKAYKEAKEEKMTKEVFESMCNEMKESYAKKLNETLLSVINKYG